MNVHTYIHTYKWVYQLVRLSVVLTFYRMLLISHCVLYEGMFVFQLRPRHSTTNSTIAMWRVCVCVSLWYAHTKLYTLLDVVMYVFLLLLRRLSCALGRCVRPSIRPSIRPFVCHLVSRQPNQRQLLKCIIFSSFFASAFSFVYAHSLVCCFFYFLPACAFFGVYIWTLLPLRVEKISKQYPTTRTKIKKELCSELSFFTVAAAATKQRIVFCCVFVSLFVRSFVCRSYVYAVSCKYVWLFMLFLLLLLLCYVVGYGGV